MIDKRENGIRAIHKLIIHARRLTGNNRSNYLFKFLDDVEYLPALMLESEDQSELFEAYLKEICSLYSLQMIYEEYVNSSPN